MNAWCSPPKQCLVGGLIILVLSQPVPLRLDGRSPPKLLAVQDLEPLGSGTPCLARNTDPLVQEPGPWSIPCFELGIQLFRWIPFSTDTGFRSSGHRVLLPRAGDLQQRRSFSLALRDVRGGQIGT